MEDINENEVLKTLQEKYQNQINEYNSAIENKIKDAQVCCIETNILSSVSHKGGYFKTAYDESCKIEDALDQEISDLKSKRASLQTILDVIDVKLQNAND